MSSGTKHPDLFAALAAAFEPQEVKTRSQQGRELHYVTARTVMNRLDNVLGPENWWDEYVPSENSVLCRLSIRLPDGSTLTKCDAGGYAGCADAGDDDKSGYSDAFKRAAVKFGVARYLYRDGVPAFAGHGQAQVPPPAAGPPTSPQTHRNGDGRHINRDVARAKLARGQGQGEGPAAAVAEAGAPQTGRQLFGWGKEHEALKQLNAYGQRRGFPPKIIDWDKAQVCEAFDALRRAMEG